MTVVATRDVRVALDPAHVVTVVGRVAGDDVAAGRRGPLPGLDGASGVVATSGVVRLGADRFVGARLYHATTPDDPDASELTFLYDDRSGHLLALAIGCDLGEMRNGALGALAAARCGASPRPVVTVVGAGRQAFAQCEYLRVTVDIAELRVVGRDAARVDAFVQRVAALGLPAQAWSSAEAAVTGADVVVTATSSRTPVIEVDWLRPGVHLTHVGTKKHGHTELPPDVLTNAGVVVVDSLPQFLADLEAGSFTNCFSADDVRGLGDVLASSDDLGPVTSLHVSNGLPGGEVALLAAWYLLEKGDVSWQ